MRRLIAVALLATAPAALAAPSDGWKGDGWYVMETFEEHFTRIVMGPAVDLARCQDIARDMVQTATQPEFYYECVKLPNPPLAEGASGFVKIPTGAVYETGRREP
jgi:hypothetical protein